MGEEKRERETSGDWKEGVFFPSISLLLSIFFSHILIKLEIKRNNDLMNFCE